MKTFKIFLALFILCTYNLSAQNYTSLVVQVLDKKSNDPISNAEFTIEESGFQKLNTDGNGKAMFDNSVPLGRIHYSCNHENYIPIDDYFNTTNIEDNTLKIYMEKVPIKNSDKILITGEVLTKNGKEIINADVELRLGNIMERTKTDVSGNYSIEINLNKLLYETDDLIIEIKNENCKKDIIVKKPSKNYLVKNIIVDCNMIATPNNDINKTNLGHWTGTWITTIEGFEQRVLLEIEFNHDGELVGNYSYGDTILGKLFFIKVEENSISGFNIGWINGKFASCGKVDFNLDSENKFRGYFTVEGFHTLSISQTDNSKHYWNGKK